MFIESTFKPAWWCKNPHLQTLWPFFFRLNANPIYKREQITLPDGDYIDLDWSNFKSSKALALILHGLEGSSSSHYVRGLVQSLALVAIPSVVMHLRGCGGEPNLLTRSYHAGDIDDIYNVIAILKERFPKTPLFVVGYSLGGNILLNYLGRSNETQSVQAAVAVSVPLLLDHCARRLEKGFSRVYQYYLVRQMRHSTKRKARTVNLPLDLNHLQQLKTFYEFDNYVTAPLHGFEDVNHYYHQCSSRQFLANIQVPTLIIHARDDPFTSENVIPESNELSQSVQFELSEHGGHCGFVAGENPLNPDYWLEKRIVKFITQQINNHKNQI